MEKAIGMVETISVARGHLIADAMLKAADVRLLACSTTCPGKFVIIVGGQVSAVKSAMSAGLAEGSESVVDSTLLPNVHEDVFRALSGSTQVEKIKDLGLIETMSSAASIEAADAVAKSAKVTLVEIRVGRGMGAKAFFSFTGEISDVKTALKAGKDIVAAKGMLVDAVAISRPSPALTETLW